MVREPADPAPDVDADHLRVLGASIASPASATAKSAAATANWMKRSIFLTSFFSTQRSGSKPLTSQAKCVECWEASKSVMGPAPERPAWRPAHVSSVPMPSGDTSPMPVTTTLRFSDATIRSPGERRYFLALSPCFSMYSTAS